MQNNPHTQHQIWHPQLAWLLAFLGIVILVLQCATPIHSNDLWWHMAIGRYILDTGKLIVDQSIFTWTYSKPHIVVYNAWLSEVILYLIYSKTGAIGLIALRYLVYCGFFALAAYFAIQRGIASNPLTWIIITLGIVLAFVAQVVQPELFSFAFMCITVWLYFSIRALGAAAWRRCYWFPIIVALWINSHGAFVMSSFFFLAVGSGELLNTRFSPNLALPRKLRTHLFIALALCVPTLLLNPYGYALPLYLLKNTITLFTSHVLGTPVTITGWESTFEYSAAPYYALDYLLVATIIYIFLVWQRIKHQQINWVSVLACIIYSIFYIKMVRTTHFFAPVFVFVGLDLLAYKADYWAWPRTYIPKVAITLCSIVFSSIIGWRTVQATICYPSFGTLLTSSIYSVYPTEEVEYIRQRPDIKKLGNLYNAGGYLLYKLWPDVLIMIDQRYYPFASWFEEYRQFASGASIQRFLDSHKPDVWLIDQDNPALITWFAHSEAWTPLFIGTSGVIFGSASNGVIVQPPSLPKAKNLAPSPRRGDGAEWLPSNGSLQQPIISPNVEHTHSPPALFNSFRTALELRQWALAERIRIQIISIAAQRSWCGAEDYYMEIANDMYIATTATRAFYNGDYATTAKTLRAKIPFEYLKSIALLSNTIMASRYWNGNDYSNARDLAIAALKVAPTNAISVYNAAIADWQYRRSEAANKLQVTDDINWQFLANILLTHKEQIPGTQAAIISILSAMQQNKLVEKPQFIIQ